MPRRSALLVASALSLAAGALTASAPAAQQGNSVPTWDREYLLETAEGAHFEIDAGASMVRHATTKTGRAFAARMVKDHGAELKEVEALADRLGVNLPEHPSATQRHEISAVLAHTGRARDRAYLRLEVGDHRMDIQVNDGEQAEGTHAEIKALSAKYLPMYREHFKLARAGAKTIGAL